MSRFVNRHDLASWLRRNGFEEKRGLGTGHWQFVHPSGVKVTLPGHGRTELARETWSNIVRDLERAGFDRRTIRKELC